MTSLLELFQKRKIRARARNKNTSFRLFHRFTSVILIFIIFLSQTVQVSFFDRAEAGNGDYRDIVSLIIDETTYSTIRPQIRRYASDIQGYLPQTRVSIVVVPKDAVPASIAAKNEKLYYEGDDGIGVSRLVGTVIIGDVPLPIVHKDGKSFPSLYPYVDFDNKRFTYDDTSGLYTFSTIQSESSDVDIWHGVINPSIGKEWDERSDIPKISAFLDKTHDFYTKSGKFTPSLVPPRVFYYDGYAESLSISRDDLYKYILFTKNIENIAYKRFTKYLLGDIQTALKQFHESSRGPEDDYINSIAGLENVTLGDDSISSESIKNLPDIQTKRIINTYLKRFHDIINTKTLGDIEKFVHNAGRYNDGIKVRLDHGAIGVTVTDEVALRTIKEANDALERSIDRTITDNNYARKIIIFDSYQSPYTGTSSLVGGEVENFSQAYHGYYFGTKSANITQPSECSISRGSSDQIATFGRSVLAEANVGYDVSLTKLHADILTADTTELVKKYRNPAYACFDKDGKPKLDSYWGGNSLLRLAVGGADPTTIFSEVPSGTSFRNFSLPIFSLAGMKETSRLAPASIDDCISDEYKYALLQPYSYIENIGGFGDAPNFVVRKWPEELGRFTCLTRHSIAPTIPSFKDSIFSYSQASNCLYGKFMLDGKYYTQSGMVNSPVNFGFGCSTTSGEGDSAYTVDNTVYEDRKYHTIPSLLRHISPTESELSAAEKSGITPSLPVDIVRSVEFLTPKSEKARLTYPNLFQSPGNTIPEIRAWLKKLSQDEWGDIITREKAKTLSSDDVKINTLLGVGDLPSSPIDWNTLISDDVLTQVISAKSALSLDITKKYKSLVETSLSYSHIYPNISPTESLPQIPRSASGYDIAYLGLVPFEPKRDAGEYDKEISDYASQIATIGGINFSEENEQDQINNNRASDGCGPPEGVALFQWPSAIMCWIRTLLPPKIIAGSCGPTTIGLSSTDAITIVPSALSGSYFPWENIPIVSPVSGPLSTLGFETLSNALIPGSESAGLLRLKDSFGNSIFPELHTVTAKIEGGVFIVGDDNTMKKEIKIDTVESDILFRYKADISGSRVRIIFTLENGLSYTEEIRIIENPHIRLTPSAPLQVGGTGVTMKVEVLDTANNVVQGFRSALSLSVPVGAGSFDDDTISIEDGKTPLFTFFPGRLAGAIPLSLDIPGIGILQTTIDIAPGIPLYIDSTTTDSTTIFSLRDRYGNLSPADTPALIQKDGASLPSLSFQRGVLTLPRSPGYWRIDAPSLSQNILNYTDETGVKQITGIAFYLVYIAAGVEKYTFLPDYNARYTVLAGDSYISEASNILYDTTPGASQSLAVTTVTTSPYDLESLFSLFPGGGYSISNSADTAIESTLDVESGLPILTLYDKSTRTRIARAGYPVLNGEKSGCEGETPGDLSCIQANEKNRVTFIRYKNQNTTLLDTPETLTLVSGNSPRITYSRTTGLTLASGIRLIPIDSLSQGYLVARIEDGGSDIGKIIIQTSPKESVEIGILTSLISKLTLATDHAYTLREAYKNEWNKKSRGYTLIKKPTSTTLDESLLGPSHIDSLGSLSETPGVGWQGNNRMLLSYAAGDSVGEASRWYHTYTMINLGDPITHVDAHAPKTELEGIDRTLGTMIASSAEKRIRSYSHRDMDGDGDEDIVIVYDDGYIDLLQNISGRFQRKQIIAYLPDLANRDLAFGDFRGDGYADILSVNASGSFVLLENSTRKFTRGDISLDAPGSLPVGVTQYKVYDMDNDGKDDIVYLSESGELAILYGTSVVGVFTKKIIESDLGVRLSETSSQAGGAIQTDTTLALPLISPTSTGSDDSVLQTEIYYPRRIGGESSDILTDATGTTIIQSAFDTSLLSGGSRNTRSPTQKDLYVRSEYAEAYGLLIEKSYKNTSSSIIHAGDKIEARISLKNTTDKTINSIKYLDTIPGIFDIADTTKYKIILGGKSQEKSLIFLSGEDYAVELRGISIPAGETLIFSYELRALPASYGNMMVDRLEGGLVGDDIYGDIGFDTSTTCGADILLWSSLAARTYEKGTRSFAPAEIPPSLVGRLSDRDKNGIPDSMENIATGALQNMYENMPDSSIPTKNPIFVSQVDPSHRILSLGFSPQAEQDIEDMVQGIADGLSCGFGGGSCLSSPINYAPLAPGSSPSLLGIPLNMFGMTPSVGIPLFSALTGIQAYCGFSSCCIPGVFPISPLGFIPGPVCGTPSAGGSLGTWAPTNTIRVYVTPTLTLGVGTAVCFGGTSIVTGTNPLYPLLPTGNCIVAAAALPFCKGDGSSTDGSVVGISGLGTSTDAWNSTSCTLQAQSRSTTVDAPLMRDIVSYLRSPTDSGLQGVNKRLSVRGGRSLDLGGPAIRIGDGSTSGTQVDIGIDTSKPFTTGNIVSIKNTRIAGFPEFIMDWVARQTDEITNKLLTLPNLVIVLPRNFSQNGVLDGGFSDVLNKFNTQSISSGFDDLKTQMGQAYDTKLSQAQKQVTKNTSSQSTRYSSLNSSQSKLSDAKSGLENKLAYGEASASSLKAAYKFISQIPFLRIEQEAVAINIPWILPGELDRYARSLESYTREIEATKKSWCVGKTPAECADIHTSVGLSGLSSSIEANLKRIQEYRKFPEKIQKYLTWKQRYIAQLLCNVEIVEKMIGGWYRDNGIRFRKWAEFYVLMKAIVSSWQPLIDLFKTKDAECSVCRNERWDLKYFKFKLLSAVIPQLPILTFPRWPDIVLDLSDIRYGIAIKVPDFRFHINPIRLPNLPGLGLPNLPNITLNLPSLPVLPAIPNLPNLPDLPSLPKIVLPNLPPPPKIPKIFGAVAAVLKILKLLTKIYCFLQKTPLVPEDYAGALIAQRTDRQGTLGFDFLSVRFPQISIPSIREIRVSTHVNLELRSDFIATFAKNAVKPINAFSADIGRSTPKTLGPNIKINTPPNINISPKQSSIQGLEKIFLPLFTSLQKEKDIMLDTGEFRTYFRSELVSAGMDPTFFDHMWITSRGEVADVEREVQKSNKERFTLLRNYLDAETAHTREQEKVLKNMYQNIPLLSENLPRAFYTSDRENIATKAHEKYSASLTNPSLSSPSFESDDSSLIRSFRGQMGRLTANMSTSSSIANASDLASGYNPLYTGIYIQTPLSKTQIRLFDYIDLVTKSDSVDVVDIDTDGDLDYIYMLGGSLYVKYSHQIDRPRSFESAITTTTLDISLLPRAPDYFDETIASPGEITLSFSPARPSDQSFRLEFFDRYIEWDRVRMIGGDTGDTPRTTIDFTVEQTPVALSSSTSTPVYRSLESVSNPEGFILEGQRVSLLPSGQTFSLSAGRALYTGNSPVTLEYTPLGLTSTEISLERFTRYTFPETLSGSIISGKIYILTPASGEKLPYSDSMIGMPLLPGTRIISPGGPIRVYDPIENISHTIVSGGEYRHISLGKPASEYRASFSYPDGFYSARLRSLSDDRTISAGVTLLSPQPSLDRTPPVVDMVSRIRIPVYQSKSISLTDIVTEMSLYTTLVDPDTLLDTDLNDIADDDFVTSSTGVSLIGGVLSLGPYDTLGTKNMKLRVQDMYGNTTFAPFTVEVYAPIPEIRTITSTGMLFGRIDEPIKDEPIHLFRIREGTPLTLVSQDSMMTKDDGVFSTGSLFVNDAILLSYSGGSIRLFENTGLPSGGSLSLRMTPATSTSAMSIIYSRGSLDIIRNTLIPPDTLRISDQSSSLPVSSPSLQITKIGNVRFLRAPLDDRSIPGGYYLTDTQGIPLVAFDRRGQIYLLDSTTTLTPSIDPSGYLLVTVKKGETSIATALYSVDFFFTMKK